MLPSKVYTKEMIWCIVLIVLGYLTTNSYSTAISVLSPGNNAHIITTTTSSPTGSSKMKYDGNDILRDGNVIQEIGFGALVKSHKKQIHGNDDGFNTNNLNDDDTYSENDIANDVDNLNAFDENEADDESNDFVSIEIDDQLSLKDQMRMLTQQMTKRFQHELKAAVRKTTKDLFKSDFEAQFEQLR